MALEESTAKKFTFEVLMEGPGGDLVFAPIQASKGDLRELIAANKNPLLSRNAYKALQEEKKRRRQ
ncbi:MAG: hypothetical protein NTW59_02660 [Candidatus Diapherotrites archaeon]|nr:hypothetical protein [Candidatus Diapherotrites archaeon]